MDDDVASVGSIQKLEDVEKIKIKKQEVIFDKKSCIIHTESDIKGKIFKVNKASLQIFGYTKGDLEKNNYITELMPK